MSISDINKGASGVNPTADSILPDQTGNSGKVLKTDGVNASWDAYSPSPAGSDTQIQFNDGGVFGGNSGLTYNKTTKNLTANNLFFGFTSVAASGSLITLTASSTPNYVITGSGGQIIKLPDATTLPKDANIFSFNNNQSSGAITVNNASGTLIASIPSGGYVILSLLDNTIPAGSWDRHDQTPSNVSWSTNTFDYSGSFTSGTWNGNAIQVNRGGTGASSLTAYAPIFGGTTPTGAIQSGTVGTAKQVLTSNGAGALPTFQDVPTSSSPATETVAGVAEIATQAETNTGTDDARFITPLKLKTNLNSISLGIGQTWQDVTGSRALSTTYTNSTGRPIAIAVGVSLGNTSTFTNLVVGGVNAGRTQGSGSGTYVYDLYAIVPNGVSYSVSGGSPTLSTWRELR